MRHVASVLIAPALMVGLALSIGGCQKEVVSSDFRPSTGMPSSHALPYHSPNMPMDLVGSSNPQSQPAMGGMKNLSDWTRQHQPHSGPRFKPQTIGPPGSID